MAEAAAEAAAVVEAAVVEAAAAVVEAAVEPVDGGSGWPAGGALSHRS